MIEVELSAVEIPIEPGGTAQLSVLVRNRQTQADHIALEIEGVDMEWYALPVPSLQVAAGEEQSARVLFRVARNSETAAGAYPFVVRAKGMESGVSGLQQATLVIKPYHSLQVELNPRRVSATFFSHANLLDVAVSNLGNLPESLDLYASDPEDACAYDFENERLSVAPGHTQTVQMQIEPVTRPIIGASRLYGFTVTARSVEDSYVSATGNGQLEKRPMLTTLTAVALLILLFSGAMAAVFWPRPVPPPVLRSFEAEPTKIEEGTEVTLRWNVTNPGSKVYIQPGSVPVTQEVGEVKVHPDKTTTYQIIAMNGAKQTTLETTVEVTPRPKPLPPKITRFEASQLRIHQGDVITLSWNVEGATKIALNPLSSSEREAALYTSQEVRPDATTTYDLAAVGPGGSAHKTLKIEVLPANVSIARINFFRVKPESITEGDKATLTWSVENAATLEIDNGVGTGLTPKGKFEVAPTTTTTYTLRIMDNKGNTTTAPPVTVTVKPKETPPGEPNPPGTVTSPETPPAPGRPDH